MTTGKTIALTRQTFIGKVMSLLFNMLSRLIITFLPRNKCLLISWLQSPSAAILELQKIKSVTVSTVYPSICHEMMGPDAMILVFWMLSFKPTFSLSSYLTYMQSTSWETLGWMKHKLESRLLGEISITSDTQMIPLLWHTGKRTKEPLDESERGEWKSWLKTQHSEN